ncbi:hypothetical protein LINPERHAP1_LOCUS18719 [Linum perenne]
MVLCSNPTPMRWLEAFSTPIWDTR